MTKQAGGRTSADRAQSVTGTVVSQIKKLRRRRGLSSAALAGRCAELGAPEITENVVRNIEIGRRTVSVDQLAVLALALDVSPAHLLAPGAADGQVPAPVRITGDVLAPPAAYSQWVRGAAPLPGHGERTFWAHVLEHEATPEDEAALVRYARHKVTGAGALLARQFAAEAAAERAADQERTRTLLEDLETAVRDGRDPTDLLAALRRIHQDA